MDIINIEIYGIKNCSSMKKAFNFLQSNNIAYEFIDFKKRALTKQTLDSVLELIDMESLINKSGSTYRKLKAQGIEISADSICDNPTIIKRPLVILKDNSGARRAFVGLAGLESLL